MDTSQPQAPHDHGQQPYGPPHGEAYGQPSSPPPSMPPRRPGVRGKVIAAVVAMCVVLIATTAAGAFLIWQRVSSGDNQQSTVFVIRLCSAQSPNPACRQQDYTDAQAAAIKETLVESAATMYVTFDEAVSVTASESSQKWTAAAFFLHTVRPEKIATIKALVEGQPGVDEVTKVGLG
ncbi:hypothetical protein GCM10027280_50040 [Micromonospora polyrhachis]|uniref:FtsX extracellular domain-containing protein n=1 Tax=Micromonospora polyrhachis TaxID=1282883 RepID=A0A7W7WRN7_9ACTN|nr:hypothetical protein [Micromonospora polyrhachis]MBB4960752.1 hypothetical protein [Micromonospora polyrhachis]